MVLAAVEYIGGEDPLVGSPIGSVPAETTRVLTVSASLSIGVHCEHNEWLGQHGAQIELPTTLSGEMSRQFLHRPLYPHVELFWRRRQNGRI